MLLTALKIITIIALIAAIIWFIFEPGFEPTITTIVIIAAIMKLYWNEMKGEPIASGLIATDSTKINSTGDVLPAQNGAADGLALGTASMSYSGGNYIGSDFSGADLVGFRSKKADYRGANFAGANLQGAHLKGSNFENANFEGANLSKANFKEANLKGANLNGADLCGAVLIKADLTGASIKNTKFAGANTKKAIMPGPVSVMSTRGQKPAGKAAAPFQYNKGDNG
ncbi:MAG: pentapeptide repeat-containing protein [Pseudomonadota bacterium]